MSFLKCLPAVYVIGDEYEVALTLSDFGVVELHVGQEVFFEENTGVLPTERSYARIRLPQSVLDGAKAYTVVFRKTMERKSYWSTLGEPEREEFTFKPIEKTENVNIYYISDVHYHFESAKKIASYFGDDTDLYVFCGDIGEVQTEEDYFEVCRLVGEVSRGSIPVVFVRGNHDTRGHLPEKYTDYFPANNKDTFFTLKVGPITAVALDLGEDKPDGHTVYGGYNRFHAFRLREDRFLKALRDRGEKFTLAISHIAPAYTAATSDSEFNIEGELYERWNGMLSELGVRAMLTGHIHEAFILDKNDGRSLRPHDFPIIVGSKTADDYLLGTALTLSGDRLTVRFTDADHSVIEEYEITLSAGEVRK